MIEINPQPAKDTRPPPHEDVSILHDQNTREYWVFFPKRGRLGDRRLLDENGQPINIGPTYRGPGEFEKISEALAHFKRVSDAFDRFR